MRLRIKIFFAIAILFSAKLFAANEIYRAVDITPPTVAREFRGAWITCVATNADWPSQSGLTVAQQKAELIALLDHAAQLKLNAVILQVRPACDAMYSSSIEPWSEYLTGTQGRAPEPVYDPLAFAIEEAHKRGLELHAWFNPFRARHNLAKSPAAANHISKTHPEFIRNYGDLQWLDPGEPAVRAYVLRVIMDVVKRYDVDGIQFDDYFYPYFDKSVGDFPDYATWKKYGNGQDQGDWRRANVNQFIQSVYQNIKTAKPWVKFGVSPFGIWRPGNPPQIKGLDAYATLYADSRLWLASGWVDYLAPQLYWPIDDAPHSFPILLNWWTQQNVKSRDVFSALNAAAVGDKFSANEIARQIQTTRTQSGASGEIFFHLKNLVDDSALNGIVRAQNFQPALVPAMPWLNSNLPDQPKSFVSINARTNLIARWEIAANDLPKWWVLQCRGTNNLWTTQILPATQTGCTFTSWMPDTISISAVDRFGNISSPATVKKSSQPPVRNGKGKLYAN
ncbi:MAG TPA: family 10 glycosylhydrolase [Methylomirabilota bacterium]|nr:family 10 glycosylhydrolase [Methylomirabilota bacterium]